ncbi:MAG: 4-(cytidine 5'-diphospho)-2-C-methyl-D-erythritol kinase [candidate division WOR-3 bacterium]
MFDKISIKALAKINLGLWVIGQRDDGYHEIITVLHLINLSDEITIEPSPTLSVECDACPAGPENLAWKAAEVMGRTNITIRIKKGIPVGGGLGGGSADAGAVMRAIRGSLSDEDLIKIGARIGSDVPFFASGLVSALARGRGELITPLRSNLSANLVLFIPCKGVDTGWAYGLLRESGAYEDRGEAERAASKLCEAVERGDLDELSRWAFNSFERVIMRQRPKLAEAREALLGARAKIALLSGSGGVVYGLFPKDSPAPELPELGGKWVATTIGGQIGNPCS